MISAAAMFSTALRVTLAVAVFLALPAIAAERQILNRGTYAGDTTGDTPYVFLNKANQNFLELFNRTGTSGLSNANAVGALSLTSVRTNAAAWRAALATAFFTNIWALNLPASTNTDIYTVPSGYRAVPTFTHTSTNTSGSGSIAYNVKIDGSYYLIVTGTSQTNIANAIATTFVLEPGDIIAANPTLAGTSSLVSLALLPSTDPLKAPRITSFIVGSNHVYTVPAGKVAINPARSELLTAAITSISPVISQTSGGALQYQSYLNGVRLGNKSFSSGGVPSFVGVIGHMMPGDVYSITSASTNTNQFAWITVYEIDQ